MSDLPLLLAEGAKEFLSSLPPLGEMTVQQQQQRSLVLTSLFGPGVRQQGLFDHAVARFGITHKEALEAERRYQQYFEQAQA
jgi:hypothetical protein